MAEVARGDESADAQLEKMGYKSELPRNLSMMSILGLYGFPPLCVPPFKLTNYISTGLSQLWVRLSQFLGR